MYQYPPKERYTTDDLRAIIRILRTPNGCPWDREQTHESIRKNLIEECYEALEAINRADNTLLAEELGDVLLQVYLHAQIAEDEAAFTFEDVADGICKKLILRHPHVFGDMSAATGDEALANWDAVKRKSKGQAPGSAPMLDIPREFPALMRAQKVQTKARMAGMDFPDLSACIAELREEMDELRQAVQSNNPSAVAEKLGDLLFSAVNVARFAELDAEETLTAATEKFINQFIKLEQSLDNLMMQHSQNELNTLWKKIKYA
ncbi:MAG: nucleoside triphosphate pyrophosphohydrolase [Oscillospiraceae bacterium]|jgi:tetrapyrrole methylase family protein/MazG family protein|nr:nucleoside triphosphate pyrophosphohydrolase [Oscillospiraceae bacterium]